MKLRRFSGLIKRLLLRYKPTPSHYNPYYPHYDPWSISIMPIIEDTGTGTSTEIARQEDDSHGHVANMLTTTPLYQNPWLSNIKSDTRNTTSDTRMVYWKSDSHGYVASLSDVLRVRAYFVLYAHLPSEIINIILDYATYWANETFTLDDPTQAIESTPNDSGDVMVLRTMPLGLCHESNSDGSCQIYGSACSWAPYRSQNPFRKVEFRILSYDQGWHLSWSSSPNWFEAHIKHTLLRQPDWSFLRIEVESENDIPPNGFKWTDVTFASPSYQPHVLVDTNMVTDLGHNHDFITNGALQQHRIVWHYLDNLNVQSDTKSEVSKSQNSGSETATAAAKFVRDLKVGDTIALWAKAKQREWLNLGQYVSIVVTWAV